MALAYRQGRLFMDQIDAAKVLPALYLPTPRVALGIALRGLAHSAIDISDGLLADLGHILERSGKGAQLAFGALPTLPVVQTYLHETVARECVLAGGDDYELCFTALPSARGGEPPPHPAGVAVTHRRITASRLAIIGADGDH
jgi:thiamine-monophosphate kinase